MALEDQPVGAGGVEVDEGHDGHVGDHVEQVPAAQPPCDEELLAHEGEVDPGDQQQDEKPRVQPEGQAQLQSPGDHEQAGQLPEGYETSRYRAIGPIAGILFEVLELVGDAQLQEEDQTGGEGDHHRQRVGPSSGRAQHPGEGDGAETEGEDQRPVPQQGETLSLINPPATP